MDPVVVLTNLIHNHLNGKHQGVYPTGLALDIANHLVQHGSQGLWLSLAGQTQLLDEYDDSEGRE